MRISTPRYVRHAAPSSFRAGMRHLKILLPERPREHLAQAAAGRAAHAIEHTIPHHFRFDFAAGKFTEALPSGEPLSAPASPDETHTVTPTVERFFNTLSIKAIYFGDQLDSCSPQLSESTVGRCFLSARAAVSA